MEPVIMKRLLMKCYDDFYVRRDLKACYQFCSPDVVAERPPFPAVRGATALREQDEGLFATFSEIVVDIHKIVIEGDSAVVHWTWSGVHSGPLDLFGTPPSGKRYRMSGLTLYEFENDLVVRQTEFSDNLGLLQQAGLVPTVEG
jgi:predicted ester cyclase